MEINGINLDDLDAEIPETLVPKEVPGRVLQLDADALAYECAAFDDDPFQQCINNFKAAIDSRLRMAGATFINLHLTGGDKGGRYDTALVKEYQGNRKDKVKPKHLAGLREWIMGYYGSGVIAKAIMHEHQEADDGMAQGNYKAIQEGHPELSVIMSIDKDLTMCSGWHCDWNSYEMNYVDGFGEIHLDESTSTKKIKGFGTSFFWAQLLMGDGADSIPGLPKLGMPLLDEYDPLKKPRKEDAKPKACGAVMAWKMLKDVKTDLDAMLLVIKAYQSYYGTESFSYVDWRGDAHNLTSGHMVLEQARLLWMRRVVDECPSVFFKQVTNDIKWDGEPNE